MMQWNSSTLRKNLLREKLSQWHRWFAWHPVKFNGTCRWCWLETIKRRLTGSGWDEKYEYQELNKGRQ